MTSAQGQEITSTVTARVTASWRAEPGGRPVAHATAAAGLLRDHSVDEGAQGAQHVLVVENVFQGAEQPRRVIDMMRSSCRDASFDAIYSMGTIEHFDATERAVAEMARVLKPGGRAIVGVPNRHDPFLRPLLATSDRPAAVVFAFDHGLVQPGRRR